MKTIKEHIPLASRRIIESNKLKKNNSMPIQLKYVEYNDANANDMWNHRSLLGIGNYSLEHNVANCGRWITRSDLGGHSESKAVALHLSDMYRDTIHIYTERQPCQYCRSLLQELAKNIPSDVIAHYLIGYNYGSGVQDLRKFYIENNCLKTHIRK